MADEKIVINMDSAEYMSGHRYGARMVSAALKRGRKLHNIESPAVNDGSDLNRCYGMKDGFNEAVAKWKKAYPAVAGSGELDYDAIRRYYYRMRKAPGKVR